MTVGRLIELLSRMNQNDEIIFWNCDAHESIEPVDTQLSEQRNDTDLEIVKGRVVLNCRSQTKRRFDIESIEEYVKDRIQGILVDQ